MDECHQGYSWLPGAGFALKFLSVADLAYGWRILDRETFLALWIVLFALLGFYLLGKIKFPHDDDDSKC